MKTNALEATGLGLMAALLAFMAAYALRFGPWLFGL